MTRLDGVTEVPTNEELHAMMNGISGGKFPSMSLVNDVEGGRKSMTWQYKLLRDIALGEKKLVDADGNGFDPLPIPKYSIHGPTEYVGVPMQLDSETVCAAVELVRTRGGNNAAAEEIGINKAVMSAIANGKTDLSRETENEFRSKVGLPLLPAVEKVEVPEGCEVRVFRPGKRPKPKRWSLPDDPARAAEYLVQRWSPEQVSKLVELLK